MLNTQKSLHSQKKFQEEGDTEPKYIFVDPESAATPGPGNIAKTIYTAEWIADQIY